MVLNENLIALDILILYMALYYLCSMHMSCLSLIANLNLPPPKMLLTHIIYHLWSKYYINNIPYPSDLLALYLSHPSYLIHSHQIITDIISHYLPHLISLLPLTDEDISSCSNNNYSMQSLILANLTLSSHSLL